MAVRSTNRQTGKLKRVRNMLNRLMMKQRFKQWVGSTEYILSVGDAGSLAEKIILKRRLRNNFMKYYRQMKQLRRFEHVNKRLEWFSNTRSSTTKNDVYQSWRLFIRRRVNAKKFLFRLSTQIDKQQANEAFSVWKQMCSVKRQKLYLDNIQELNRRKEDHEKSIKRF
mmetsp:Transcript_21292/g.32956  ORF Transcript_21292/g.32956 Transcript_21292/m.32956 type:complete len:168 (+) Transcript_21292:1109-1612(+)